jgi:hypothetical protein
LRGGRDSTRAQRSLGASASVETGLVNLWRLVSTEPIGPDGGVVQSPLPGMLAEFPSEAERCADAGRVSKLRGETGDRGQRLGEASGALGDRGP